MWRGVVRYILFNIDAAYFLHALTPLPLLLIIVGDAFFFFKRTFSPSQPSFSLSKIKLQTNSRGGISFAEMPETSAPPPFRQGLGAGLTDCQGWCHRDGNLRKMQRDTVALILCALSVERGLEHSPSFQLTSFLQWL